MGIVFVARCSVCKTEYKGKTGLKASKKARGCEKRCGGETFIAVLLGKGKKYLSRK